MRTHIVAAMVELNKVLSAGRESHTSEECELADRVFWELAGVSRSILDYALGLDREIEESAFGDYLDAVSDAEVVCFKLADRWEERGDAQPEDFASISFAIRDALMEAAAKVAALRASKPHVAEVSLSTLQDAACQAVTEYFGPGGDIYSPMAHLRALTRGLAPTPALQRKANE